jgi:hypothetical protein
MARISDLPPEVLAVVFEHLAADRPDDPPGQHARTHSRTNFAFSHVCGRWRAVALAEPQLWTRVHVLSPTPDCLPAMIARSRDLPLIVGIPLPPGILPERRSNRGAHYPGHRYTTESVPPFELALSLLHRIADLDIAVRIWMKCRTVVCREGASCAPLLRRLRVDGADGLYNDNTSPLPRSLLAGGAPLLEHLELYRTSVMLLWSDVQLPCLRILSVRGANYTQWSSSTHAENEYSLHGLLRTLAHSPRLEELALFNSIPAPSGLPGEVVHLAHLRRLTLQSSAARLVPLLAALSFPEDTALVLLSNSFAAESADLADQLAPRLAGRFCAVTLHITGQLVHWIAHKNGPGSEVVGEWSTRCAITAIDVPAVFKDTRTLAFRLARRQSTLATLCSLSVALPNLMTLRVNGSSTCTQCVHAFRKLPVDAFPHLREWELADLDPRPYVGASIGKALEARRAQGHATLVLRIPKSVLGSWAASAIEEKLAGSVEVLPPKECYTATPSVRREDYTW